MRTNRLAATIVSVVLVLAVLEPLRREPWDDSFPLSPYAMFAFKRPTKLTMDYAYGVTPSGVSELDDEAVRAFHASAPFPNPPDGLANKDGVITFAFSFFLEIGSPRTSWRVIRSM